MSSPEEQGPSNPSPEPESFELAVHDNGRDAVWIAVAGQLDAVSAPRLVPSLETALSRARLVVLDLRRLVFLDSAGMAEIVRAHNQARRDGRRFLLVQGPPRVERLLELAGLAEVLEVADLGSGRVHVATPQDPGA